MRRINDKMKDAEMAKMWYRTFVGIALVGGIFSLIVCALLLINHF